MEFKISTRCNAIIIITILLSSIFSTTPAFAEDSIQSASQIDPAITLAFEYINTQMNEDGGIRWFDETSNVATTIRTVTALASAGLSQDALLSTAGGRPVDYLITSGTDWIYQIDTEQPGLNVARSGQLLTAVASANQNPYAFGSESIDLIHLIKSNYDQNAGSFGDAAQDAVLDQVWAMIGLGAANASIPEDSVTWLMDAQNPDGSWDDGFGSFLDTTPLGIIALASSNQNDLVLSTVQSAVAFILDNQQPDGGWQTEWDSATNANTTGMMIQALIAARDIGTEIDVEIITTGQLALLEIQQENGMIGGDFANAYSTAEAVLGLSDQTINNLGYLNRVSQAYDFIFDEQQIDGGWGSVGQTLGVILALTAAGWDPQTVLQNGSDPISFLSVNLPEYLKSGPDAIGKSILSLVSAGYDPAYFNGIDLVTMLLDTFDSDSAAFGDRNNSWHQSLALLGLSAAGAAIPEGAELSLTLLQQENGGWEYLPGFGTSADNTSLAIQALLAAGWSVENEIIINGLNYIQAQQTIDGGWGDSSTTAFAMTALNSLDIPFSNWTTENQRSPLENIFTYQTSSGGFYFSDEFPEPNLMSTTSAVFAVLSGSFIITPEWIDKSNYAGLVIYSVGQDVKTACVNFDSPSISGFELLDNSGIPYEVQDGFINSINGLSNEQGDTMYWAYWRWDGREWGFNNTGAADSIVYPGSVEAWHFTSWEVFPSLPPEFTPAINQFCSQPVLRNYSDQPYLNYWNLNPTIITQAEEITAVPEPTSDKSIDETSIMPDQTPANNIEPSAENTRINTPIIIISVVGLFILVLIAYLLIKKK